MGPANPTSIGPTADYNARPAPNHYGDYFGSDAGYSTVYQTGLGYDLLNGVRDAEVGTIASRSSAVQMAGPAPARNWMQTAGAGVLILAVLSFYIDERLAR